MNLKNQFLDAAIIDLDGTMVDTLGDFVVAINLMLGDLGHAPVDRALVELHIGKGSEHLVSSVLLHVFNHAADQQMRSQAASENIAFNARGLALYQAHYRTINGQHARVYAGVVEGLRLLQAGGLKLACLTNKPVVFARELLRLKGLDGFFSEVFGGDSFAVKKPDALPVIKTCEALGTVPARTLMVGDSINDAQAARAAGCPVVLVTYGYNHGEPVTSAGADGTIGSLTELGQLV
jgi:phosphoglycolate phosphatase